MNLKTPIIFIIFNRPDLTQRVFSEIAKARPERLLVVADAPRFPEDAEKCEQTRKVLNGIDWDCQLQTNYADRNLGCKERVSSGLDWAFSLIEEAIILEDDCLPGPSFFNFCQTLLEYYRFDERVMHISGDNFQSGRKRSPFSYYFSKYTHCWGWATWRRAWKHYDKKMETWPYFKESMVIEQICEDPYEQRYWTDIFERTYQNLIDTWDYQWLYCCWTRNGLSILPNSNLISNIGFRLDGTHTFGNSPLAQLPTIDISEIKHPPFVFRNRSTDAYSFDTVFGGNDIKKSDKLVPKLRRKFSFIKRKFGALF